VAYDHISFYMRLNLREVCKPRTLHRSCGLSTD
jgi:hypothetical protein